MAERMKRNVVIWLELLCSLTHLPGVTRHPFALWSWRLDRRWDTGVWADATDERPLAL